jgi:hypothetical protein
VTTHQPTSPVAGPPSLKLSRTTSTIMVGRQLFESTYVIVLLAAWIAVDSVIVHLVSTRDTQR